MTHTREEAEIYATEYDACRALATREAQEQAEEEQRYQQKVLHNKSWNVNASYHRRQLKKAKQDIEYHTKALNYAAGKVKWEKQGART